MPRSVWPVFLSTSVSLLVSLFGTRLQGDDENHFTWLRNSEPTIITSDGNSITNCWVVDYRIGDHGGIDSLRLQRIDGRRGAWPMVLGARGVRALRLGKRTLIYDDALDALFDGASLAKQRNSEAPEPASGTPAERFERRNDLPQVPLEELAHVDVPRQAEDAPNVGREPDAPNDAAKFQVASPGWDEVAVTNNDRPVSRNEDPLGLLFVYVAIVGALIGGLCPALVIGFSDAPAESKAWRLGACVPVGAVLGAVIACVVAAIFMIIAAFWLIAALLAAAAAGCCCKCCCG